MHTLPTMADGETKRYAFRLDDDLSGDLDALVKALQAEQPAFPWNRSAALRFALDAELRRRGIRGPSPAKPKRRK